MTCQLCQRSSSVCTEAAAGDLIVPSISSMLILYGQRIINHQSKSFTQPFLCKEETIVPSPFNLAFLDTIVAFDECRQGLKIVPFVSFEISSLMSPVGNNKVIVLQGSCELMIMT